MDSNVNEKGIFFGGFKVQHSHRLLTEFLLGDNQAKRHVAMRVRKESSEFQFLRNQFLTQFEKLSENNNQKQAK